MLFGMVQPSEQRHTIRKTVGRFKDFKALSVSQVSNQERRMFGSRWTINKQTNKQTNFSTTAELKNAFWKDPIFRKASYC